MYSQSFSYAKLGDRNSVHDAWIHNLRCSNKKSASLLCTGSVLHGTLACPQSTLCPGDVADVSWGDNGSWANTPALHPPVSIIIWCQGYGLYAMESSVHNQCWLLTFVSRLQCLRTFACLLCPAYFVTRACQSAGVGIVSHPSKKILLQLCGKTHNWSTCQLESPQ